MTDFAITDTASADALVATIRAAVNGAGKYATFVENNTVTRETVKHAAVALATRAYPNDKPVQAVGGKRTRFGNAVQAAGNGLRAALENEPGETKPVNLLTKAGLAADLETVIAAWRQAQQ